MIERYSYVERIFSQHDNISSGLSLAENVNPALRIFRLLSGSCDIKDEYSSQVFKMRVNYLSIPFEKITRLKKNAILKHFPDEITLEDLSEYFLNFKTNKDFYKLIEFELINCLTSRSQGRYLEAFIFLYRLLEGISYSVPLMYISKSKNFMKSFKSLQAAMPTSDKEGELLLFKNFIDLHWSGKPFFNLTMDINLSEIDVEEMREIYFKIYKNHVPKNGIESETEDEEIKVKFVDFRGFLVSIRNRYFHFLQGGWQKNIETGEIVFPDLFFKPLIDLGLNWIAISLFEIIVFDIDNNEQ
ncbi:Uncharacterised protein [Janthinobacterium lividum]|nr:Uncharacterised protein [Janthinobacterium lividum]